MDKEFSKIELKSVEKKRYVDKLVKVYLKSGKEQWVLIHIEVQGYPKEKIQFLFRFIDGLLQIHDLAEEKLFFEQVKQIKGKENMEFMTNFEHASFLRGKEKGRKKSLA